MSNEEVKVEEKEQEEVECEDVEYALNLVEEADNHNSQSQSNGTARFELHILCERAGVDEDEDVAPDERRSWDVVREWLRQNESVSEEAIMERVDNDTTALHFACRNDPPVDVIEHMITVAPKAIELSDKFGWTALHYACANNTSVEVIRVLVTSHPECTTAQTERGLTPLHFALGNRAVPPTPQAVTLLASFQATSSPDANGMVPLHYACAYGASQDVLNTLLEIDAATANSVDSKGRTPLFYAMGNCERDSSPMIVETLLEVVTALSYNHSDQTNINHKIASPLRLLSLRSANLANDTKQRDNVTRCLDIYLSNLTRRRQGTDNVDLVGTEFLTTLQSFPEWLRDQAVVHPSVQTILNDKISQRFPSAVMLLDLYFTCGIILCFSINIASCLETPEYWTGEFHKSVVNLIPLHIGAVYFFLREFIQIMSMSSLGLFSLWFKDVTNWLDIFYIIILLFWATVMQRGWALDEISFRTGAAFSSTILYLNFLSFLRSLYFDFAVFVSGVWNVLQLLVAFITSTMIILFMFMQVFFTIFQQTIGCVWEQSLTDFTSSHCHIDDTFQNFMTMDKDLHQAEVCLCEAEKLKNEHPFCSYWTSFLKVYTMLLGEIDENMFLETNKIALCFFVIFMFLVVILLASVLIALVTDSYDVIKNERAGIVFWSNRLNFIAEMDAVSSVPWKKKVRKFYKRTLSKLKQSNNDMAADDNELSSSSDKLRELWKGMNELLLESTAVTHPEIKVFSKDYASHILARILTALIIIPLWILLGVLSAGFLWPPQVREFLFVQKVSSEQQGKDDLYNMEKRKAEVEVLKKELEMLHDEINKQMYLEKDKAKMIQSQITNLKSNVMNEMKEIKQLMTLLFELQANMAAI